MARHICRILVFTLIMALCFAMICPSSFAEVHLLDSPSGVSNSFNFGSSSFRALMASILVACNIAVDSTLPVVAPVADFIENPFNITDTVMDSVEYAFPWLPDYESPRETLADYMAREGTLVVRGDDVVIDGKHYTDIWLDTDSAQAMRTNVLDLETAWNIASNSSGIFVSGAGNVGGVPMFQTSSGLRSQQYLGVDQPFAFSGISFSPFLLDGTYHNFTASSSSGSVSSNFRNTAATYPVTYFDVRILNNRPAAYWQTNNRPGWNFYLDVGSIAPYVDEPFDYTWVSQSIPAPTLDPGQGLSIRVPNEPTEWSDPVVRQTINNFNNNMTFSPNVEISLGDPGVMDTLDTLLTGLGDLILLLKPTIGPSPISPVDPTVIANTPWVRLQTKLDSIIAHLQSVIDATIAQNNYLATFHATVISGFATIASAISSIASQIGDIGSSIVNGDKKWFKEVVDSIKAPFLPILQSLAGITGIWRYVVSWFGNISTPFTFFFSVLGASGAYFLSPFYALAAGCIVIAIYRRFGK